MRTFLSYLWRIARSVPVIGATIVDVIILLANALGVQLTLPTWAYGAILGLGYLWENFRIFSELEAKKVEANIVCGVYGDNHQKWADAISYTIPENPDFRPTFGLVITTDKPGTTYKGVFVSLSFSWRGDPLNKGIAIRPPSQDKRWEEISGHITNTGPAIFKFNAPEEVITNGVPVLLQHLTFHVVEPLKGSILIQCVVTGLEPRAAKTSEVVINLSPQAAG